MPTTDFGLPYPDDTNDPNGPAQIQALAQFVNDKYPRGTSGGKVVGPSVSLDILSTDAVTAIIAKSFNVIAGRRYLVVASINGAGQITASGYPTVHVSLSGVTTAADYVRPYSLSVGLTASPSASSPVFGSAERIYDATVTGSLTLSMTAQDTATTASTGAYRTNVNTHEMHLIDLGLAV